MRLRERYDQLGEKGEEAPPIDPLLFFGILFGSEQCGSVKLSACGAYIGVEKV